MDRYLKTELFLVQWYNTKAREVIPQISYGSLAFFFSATKNTLSNRHQNSRKLVQLFILLGPKR